MPLIGVMHIDTGESMVIELKYITRYSSTGTAADTGRVDMWLSQFLELGS
jgi:hypothetical protein